MMLYIVLVAVVVVASVPVALSAAEQYRRLRHNWRMDNLHIWSATQAARMDVLERYDYHEHNRDVARLEIKRNRARLLAEVSE